MYSCNLMCCTDFVMFCFVESRLACVAAVSFPFQADEQASEEAHPRWAKDWGEGGGGEREGGGNGVASPPPSAPYFSHSLSVSFPSRKFLETPATQAKLRCILFSSCCVVFCVVELCFVAFCTFFCCVLVVVVLFCVLFCCVVFWCDVFVCVVLWTALGIVLLCWMFFWGVVLCCAPNKITGWHVR